MSVGDPIPRPTAGLTEGALPTLGVPKPKQSQPMLAYPSGSLPALGSVASLIAPLPPVPNSRADAEEDYLSRLLTLAFCAFCGVADYAIMVH